MPDPDDDARIRSLLASLREDGPVPDDVAARLDDRLAELAPAARPSWGRRNARRLLAVAAVVVIVGGVGATAVRLVQGSGGGVSSASSADTGSEAGSKAGSQAGSEAGSEARSDPGTGGGKTLASQPPRRNGVPLLTDATFRAEAEAEFARPGVLSPGPPGSGCATVDPRAELERQVPVLFDRRPAVLAAYAVQDGTRLVQVIGCSDGEVRASTRVAVG